MGGNQDTSAPFPVYTFMTFEKHKKVLKFFPLLTGLHKKGILKFNWQIWLIWWETAMAGVELMTYLGA